MVAGVSLYSQESSQESYLELLRSDLRTQKVAIVTLNMELTDAQGQVFWPIYRKYDTELTTLNDQRIAVIKDYAENHEKMTDSKADALTKQVFSFLGRRLKLQEKYYQEFAKALNPVLAAKYMQIERQINALVAVLCAALLAPGEWIISAGAAQTSTAQTAAAPEAAVKLSNDQLDSLVAPIALYPDPLLSQTLVASTYPLEVIQLQQWLEKNKDLKDQALADAVKKQDWDPSIQAMGSFPDVVDRLHPYLGQRAGVLDFLPADAAPPRLVRGIVLVCRPAMEDAALAHRHAETRVLRVVRVLRLLFGVQVVEIAEEFIESVDGGEELVKISHVVLAELAGRIPQGLEEIRDRRVFRLQPEVHPRPLDLG